MSDIKLIEELDETSASELVDSDLLMTSVRNNNGSYTSKKMTLGALADYVNSQSDGSSTSTKSYIGGPLIYDTDECGDVLTTQQQVEAWEQDSNTNYLWDLVVGHFEGTDPSTNRPKTYGVVTGFTKTVSKDCLVWIKYAGATSDYGYWASNSLSEWHSNRAFYLKIDEQDINPWLFRGTTGTEGYIFFLAAGQKIEIGMSGKYPRAAQSVVRILPIISGAGFFIDTHTDKWDFGLDNDTTSTGGFTHAGIAIDHKIDGQNYTFQYTATKSPTRLIIQNSASLFNTSYANPGNEYVQINGSKVLCDDTGGDDNKLAFNLRKGDELKITSNITGAAIFSAYPIIMD